MRPIDLSGQRFGRLVATTRCASERQKVRWFCRCDCGGTIVTTVANLRRGDTASCGCFKAEKLRDEKTTHGNSNSVEYVAWLNMRARCSDESRPDFARYGGRGIGVCARWNASFETFIADMGRKPSPEHSIDRINNDGNYEPGNCRWATPSEQERNKRRRLSTEAIIQIRRSKESNTVLATRFNVSRTAIHRVRSNQSFAWVADQ